MRARRELRVRCLREIGRVRVLCFLCRRLRRLVGVFCFISLFIWLIKLCRCTLRRMSIRSSCRMLFAVSTRFLLERSRARVDAVLYIDQMGVEFGRILAKNILIQLEKPEDVKVHDSCIVVILIASWVSCVTPMFLWVFSLFISYLYSRATSPRLQIT